MSILSVSRRTDIPAFYAEWFFNRVKEGFVYVRNPIVKSNVSKIALNPQVIDFIVFWTKNPSLYFVDNLHFISDYNYYFQFTITPYDSSIEQDIVGKQKVMDTFIELSKKIGKERIIWRYDPILLSEEYSIEKHVNFFEDMVKQLHPYTEKCIISFIDFYKKTERNLSGTSVGVLDNKEIVEIASSFAKIANTYGIKLETCAEYVDFQYIGINHGRCIDNELVEKITGKMVLAKKDKNQRDKCLCIESIDIGEYNTCLHNCLYCYANYSREKVIENAKMHDKYSPLLIGNVKVEDEIKDRKMFSVLDRTLF